MDDKLKQILNLAVWAPSGDNSQPWKFTVENNSRVVVQCLPENDNPILNVDYSGTYIAHGALLENIDIAASHFGLKTIVNLFPDQSNQNIVATINFFNGDVAEDPLFDCITKRCTNRKPYKKHSLEKEQEFELQKSIQNIEGVGLKFISDKQDVKKLSTAFSVMERVALENRELHRLFFSDIIWDKRTNDVGGKGLYIKTMELPLPAQYLFRLLKYWSFVKILNKIGFSKLAALGNAQVYASSSLLGAIMLPGSSKNDYILTGRAMQRLWLAATKLGLSLQLVSGTIFLGKKVQSNASGIFSDKHKDQIIKANKIISDIFKIGDQNIHMMFRIGYAGNPTARAARLAIQ